jgi:hypothetical protein
MVRQMHQGPENHRCSNDSAGPASSDVENDTEQMQRRLKKRDGFFSEGVGLG